MLWKIKQNSMKRNHSNQWRSAISFLLPNLAGTFLLVLIPFLDVMRRSFFQAVGGGFVGLDNFTQVIGNGAFRLAAWNTLRFLAVCLPLLILLSLAAAVLVDALPFARQFCRTTLMVPMAVPVASVVLLWKLFFHSQGLLSQAVANLGLAGPVGTVDWMNGKASFFVLLFTYVWKNLGYDMAIWLAGLEGISRELYEAAKVDGAGAWSSFWYITLPGLAPTASLVFFLSLFNSFKVFREAYLISGDYPHEGIYMLQHLFNNWFASLDIQKMSAASVLLEFAVMIPIIVFSVRRRRA